MRAGMRDRGAMRAYALDGAMLWFQPATGLSVRIADERTASSRRRAPRVAMFGITNACNLACEFCSRDVTRESAWTVETAAAALRGLAAAGTLEVAYGGGEPFVWKGFAALVAEVHDTTVLAQHVTTNGTRIDAATWPRFAGRFGEVRISIYDETWRRAAGVLSGAGQRWGANLIVDGAALPRLPEQLAALAAAGCHDVSLLAYVGPDVSRHLTPAGEARLARVIDDSPIACRLSVCFGDRIGVPRLPTGDSDDCGAGRDFVSITPDRRVQACSFQGRSWPGATAEEILTAWRTQQGLLAEPSDRRGCARALPLAETETLPAETSAPPVAIWQGFAGNNSGECVLVARFERVEDAEALMAQLAPGFVPDRDYSQAWKDLFVAEGLLDAEARTDNREDDPSPHALVAIGRTVIAASHAIEDAFPELRALAWKRGASVAPGGVHEHDPAALIVAVEAADAADREVLAAILTLETEAHAIEAAIQRAAARATLGGLVPDEPSEPPGVVAFAHGDAVIAMVRVLGGWPGKSLVEARDWLAAEVGSRVHAVALVFTDDPAAALFAARDRLDDRPAQTPRLWIGFGLRDGAEAEAEDFARTLPGARAIVAGRHVLVDPAPDRARLAVLALRRGAHVHALDGTRVVAEGAMRFDRDAPRYIAPHGALDPPAAEGVLRRFLPAGHIGAIAWTEHAWRPNHTVAIETDAPSDVLAALTRYARAIGATEELSLREVDPVAAACRRVLDAIRV